MIRSEFKVKSCMLEPESQFKLLYHEPYDSVKQGIAKVLLL